MPRIPWRVLLMLLLTTWLWAQQPSTTQPAPASPGKPASTPPALPSAPSSQRLPSKETVESFMKHWFGYDPEVSFQVAQIQPSEVPGVGEVTVALEKGGQRQSMVLYVLPDEKHAFTGEIIPFGADPFAPARQKLAASTTGIARGPENSTLTLVEFTDLQCPHCKDAQPIIDRLLTDFPNARFVFQPFPIEASHPWAFKAATWGECIGRENNAAFWKFVHAVYNDQLNIDLQNADAKLREHAAAAGADAAKAAACAASPETAKAVRQSFEQGKSVGVTGTPTLFINGRKVMGLTTVPYDALKQLVQFSESPASK